MSDALHQLLEVQEEDTVGDQLRHRRDHHPLRAELAAADARRDDVQARLSQERERLAELAGRQDGLDAEVAAARSRMEGIEKRMYSGQVAASRDLQAMSEEVDALRSRISGLEDATLEVMEEREPVEAQVARLEAELDAAVADRDRLAGELDRATGGIRAEEEQHAERRGALAASVPTDLLGRYERLRERLGGVGVARLVNGSCTGCHLSLPATELERLRKAPPDAVLTCEQCGRILVRG